MAALRLGHMTRLNAAREQTFIQARVEELEVKEELQLQSEPLTEATDSRPPLGPKTRSHRITSFRSPQDIERKV
ncbi:hypothetical protein EYF80_060949 [Liparis tanakae]|uniref:Uncharacterized protein n=1 Tax=Liparis tanakae TaxID=230148 RepID=A0A4Z2EKM0_9TELE|nr:hypothetical protein EYF80_060949 [Liparis tanakae]